MRKQLRLKLQTADRVRDFLRAHPDPENAGFTAATAELEERLARAEALAQQARSGTATVRAAVRVRARQRAEIAALVRVLDGIADRVRHADPKLPLAIAPLPLRGSAAAFTAAARAALDEARTHEARLTQFGLPAGLLDRIAAELELFTQRLDDKHAARAAHVGANAALEELVDEVMVTIRLLDALCEYRFRGNAETLAAWRAARNVAWPLGARDAAPAAQPNAA